MSSHAHERNFTDERLREPKPHDMDLQISCVLHSEISAQGIVSGVAPTPGRGGPQACATEGIEGRGRASVPDHVHMLLSIPPKYAVSQVVGYIKGKSAIHLARVYGERKRNFVGQHFWARGFFVNTVGRDEDAIRAYFRNQKKEDQRLEH